VLSLLLQVALIALAVVGVWRNVTGDSLSLYFVLCLCSFFFGAINSCREIVKERILFLRERMFNLSVPAYVLSKYWIQAVILAVQSLLLGLIVAFFIPLDVSTGVIIFVLFAVGSCGVSIGLLISVMVRSSDKALIYVPLLVIPQILFSDFMLGTNQLNNWTGIAQSVMPVQWGYEVLEQLWRDEWNWGEAMIRLFAVISLIVVAYFLTVLRLRRVRD